MRSKVFAGFFVRQCYRFDREPDGIPVFDFAGAKHEFGNVTVQTVYMGYVFFQWRSELYTTGKHDQVSDRYAGNDFSQRFCTAFILN